MVDEVDERRMHDVPKPRIGGIAVFFGFAFALFAVLGFALTSPFRFFRRRCTQKSHAKQIDASTDQLDARTISSDCSSAAC